MDGLDGAGRTALQLWVNGVIAQTSVCKSPMNTTGWSYAYMFLGSPTQNTNSTQSFQRMLAGAAIYTTVLSPSRILSHYFSVPLPAPPPPPPSPAPPQANAGVCANATMTPYGQAVLADAPKERPLAAL